MIDLHIPRSAVRVLLAEQLREPIAIFWGFVAPLIYVLFSLNAHTGPSQSPDWVHTRISWGLTYIALSGALFGYGLYLVGRRESGFVRSFLHTAKRRRHFIATQFRASLIMTLVYGSGLLLFCVMLFSQTTFAWLLSLWLRFVVLAALLMYAANILSVLPLTFQSVSSVTSIGLTVSTLVAIATDQHDVAGLSWRYLNPFYTATQFMLGGLDSRPGLLAVSAVVVVALGTYGWVKPRINPEWSNRR